MRRNGDTVLRQARDEARTLPPALPMTEDPA